METEEYRHIKCPGDNCDKTLRIKVTPAIYGKTVVVSCPEPACGAKARVTIPVPAPKPRPRTIPDLPDFGDLPEGADLGILRDLLSRTK